MHQTRHPEYKGASRSLRKKPQRGGAGKRHATGDRTEMEMRAVGGGTGSNVQPTDQRRTRARLGKDAAVCAAGEVGIRPTARRSIAGRTRGVDDTRPQGWSNGNTITRRRRRVDARAHTEVHHHPPQTSRRSGSSWVLLGAPVTSMYGVPEIALATGSGEAAPLLPLPTRLQGPGEGTKRSEHLEKVGMRAEHGIASLRRVATTAEHGTTSSGETLPPSRYLSPHLAEGLELVDELVNEVEGPLLGDDEARIPTVQEGVEHLAVVFPGLEVVVELHLSHDRAPSHTARAKHRPSTSPQREGMERPTAAGLEKGISSARFAGHLAPVPSRGITPGCATHHPPPHQRFSSPPPLAPTRVTATNDPFHPRLSWRTCGGSEAPCRSTGKARRRCTGWRSPPPPATCPADADSEMIRHDARCAQPEGTPTR